jgi:hypothetical protein
MSISSINGIPVSALSEVDGVPLSTLSHINGQALGAGLAAVGQALLYTGNGATNNVTGADFSPDLVITRTREPAGGNWNWVDTLRGVTKSIRSNSVAAELTEATGLTSFDANGFTLGAAAGYNNNADDFFALLLREVANAFDIVLYTGTGSAHAENHGLGVVPELIIVRNRSGTANWAVYPGPLASPGTKFLQLQTNAAVSTSVTVWNNTDATSTQFTVGTSSSVNTNGHNYVAYLFASLNPGVKVGSYTGDGNANGPVITTGFRPRFVIIKITSTTGGWRVFDNQRDASSPHNTWSGIDGDLTETVTTNAAGGVDFLATGFQSIDSAAAAINNVGATYIYLAIA